MSLDIISVLFAQFLKANEMIHLISKILSECLLMNVHDIGYKFIGNQMIINTILKRLCDKIFEAGIYIPISLMNNKCCLRFNDISKQGHMV